MATEERVAGEQIDVGVMLRILEVARQLARPFELVALLQEVISAGRAALAADRGTVFLYDAKNRELYSTVATGAKEIRFSIDKGIAGDSARTRKTINVPDCYADARFNREVDIKTGYRTRCLVAVPLIGLDDELVGVMQLINPEKGCIDSLDEKIAEALASQAAAAIQRVRLIEERMVKMKLERDLALARQIQMSVLPKTLPTCDGYDLAVFSQPADQTGGDIYDLIPVQPDLKKVLILLADATGHGVGPAISVTQVRAMLRIGQQIGGRLDDIVTHINNQLNADLEGTRFVTAFMGFLDPGRHCIDYHAAGQGPLLHFNAKEKRATFYPASTLPLGVLPEMLLEPTPPIVLEPGDVFALLTDGFYEYQNREGKQMGQERIGDVIARQCDRKASEILDAILEELGEFSVGAPQLDDLTAVLIKRNR